MLLRQRAFDELVDGEERISRREDSLELTAIRKANPDPRLHHSSAPLSNRKKTQRTCGHLPAFSLFFLFSSLSLNALVNNGASTSCSLLRTCPANAVCSSDAVGAK